MKIEWAPLSLSCEQGEKRKIKTFLPWSCVILSFIKRLMLMGWKIKPYRVVRCSHKFITIANSLSAHFFYFHSLKLFVTELLMMMTGEGDIKQSQLNINRIIFRCCSHGEIFQSTANSQTSQIIHSRRPKCVMFFRKCVTPTHTLSRTGTTVSHSNVAYYTHFHILASKLIPMMMWCDVVTNTNSRLTRWFSLNRRVSNEAHVSSLKIG